MADTLWKLLYQHDIQLWHRRFGHCHIAAVERAIKHSGVGVQLDKSDIPPPAVVSPVWVASSTGIHSHHLNIKQTRPMEIIYSDLRDPFNTRTYTHKIYWAVFTDFVSSLVPSGLPDFF